MAAWTNSMTKTSKEERSAGDLIKENAATGYVANMTIDVPIENVANGVMVLTIVEG